MSKPVPAYDEKRLVLMLNSLSRLTEKYDLLFSSEEKYLLEQVNVLIKRVHTLLENGSKLSTDSEVRMFLR